MTSRHEFRTEAVTDGNTEASANLVGLLHEASACGPFPVDGARIPQVSGAFFPPVTRRSAPRVSLDRKSVV